MRNVISLLCLLFLPLAAMGHSLDSMFISIAEEKNNAYRVVVTPSAKGDVDNIPSMIFPEICDVTSPLENFYHLTCSQSIVGQTIKVEYLYQQMDVNIVMNYQQLNGMSNIQEAQHTNSVVVETSNLSSSEYSLKGGFTHMMSGFEHVILVLLITVLFPQISQLVKVISVFTLSHLTSMFTGEYLVNIVSGNSAAFTIYMAIAILSYQLIKHGKEVRVPILMFALIGFYHGIAMYGAVDELQRQGLELIELAYFNLGIELAQLMIILGVVTIRAVSKKLSFVPREVQRNALLSYYCCGAFGMYGMTVYLISNVKNWFV
ncbi:HupE/UreJ family protein [Vibrio astriarenae]